MAAREAIRRTAERRPELLAAATLDSADQTVLRELTATRTRTEREGSEDMGAMEMMEKGQLMERPRMQAGDTVRVHVRVKEGDKERIQIFEGIIINLRRGGMRGSFTVRKVSFGQGVERIFPLHSPIIQKIDVVRSAKVRRAKLYFLRELKGKAARMKEVKRVQSS